MRTCVAVLAALLALLLLAAPVSAQIIATAAPLPQASGPGAPSAGGESKVAFHLMAAPFARWDFNSTMANSEFLPGAAGSTVLDSSPNSDFLVAGELAVAPNDTVSLAFGGWFNKIGKGDVEIHTAIPTSGGTIRVDDSFEVDFGHVWEAHAALFIKKIGVQGGILGFGGGDDVGDVPKDYDVFGVLKHGSSGEERPWAISAGAGIYKIGDGGPTQFSAFAAGSLALVKGLGIDVSYWYIGKSEDLDNDASRFTVGVGYTFR